MDLRLPRVFSTASMRNKEFASVSSRFNAALNIPGRRHLPPELLTPDSLNSCLLPIRLPRDLQQLLDRLQCDRVFQRTEVSRISTFRSREDSAPENLARPGLW